MEKRHTDGRPIFGRPFSAAMVIRDHTSHTDGHTEPGEGVTAAMVIRDHTSTQDGHTDGRRTPGTPARGPRRGFLLLYIHYRMCEYSPNFETYQRKRPRAWQMAMEKRKAKKQKEPRKITEKRQ